MSAQNQKKYLISLFENAPSFTFLVLAHFSDGLRLAGWTSAVLAAIVLGFIIWRRTMPHPILLGLNIFMLLAAPVIESIYHFGSKNLAEFLISHIQVGVMLSVFFVGISFTFFLPCGFLGINGLTNRQNRKLSSLMLAINAGAVIWTIVFEGEQLLAIGIPLAVLFGVRQFLLARVADRNIGLTGPLLVPTSLALTENHFDGMVHSV